MENQTVELAIEGMTCSHCAEAIRRALSNVPGAAHAAVSFPERRADLETKGVVPAVLVRAVEEAGYRAAVVEPPKSQAAPPQRTPHMSSGRTPDLVVLVAAPPGSRPRFTRRIWVRASR